MYSSVKRLYHEGRLNDAGLERAVTIGWITQEQHDEIYETAPHNQAPEEPEAPVEEEETPEEAPEVPVEEEPVEEEEEIPAPDENQ